MTQAKILRYNVDGGYAHQPWDGDVPGLGQTITIELGTSQVHTIVTGITHRMTETDDNIRTLIHTRTIVQ